MLEIRIAWCGKELNLRYAIALTGGIGSGKSTVATLLRLYGYHVICADAISHTLLQESKEPILAIFGDGILASDSTIDRKKLGEIVFTDPVLRKQVESLLHPKIRAEILRQAQMEEQKQIPYFIDIPLFFECGNYPIERSLLIFTTQDLQITRLNIRNGWTKEQALKRINAQMPLEQKRALASHVIENCGSLESLQQALEKYLKSFEI